MARPLPPCDVYQSIQSTKKANGSSNSFANHLAVPGVSNKNVYVLRACSIRALQAHGRNLGPLRNGSPADCQANAARTTDDE